MTIYFLLKQDCLRLYSFPESYHRNERKFETISNNKQLAIIELLFMFEYYRCSIEHLEEIYFTPKPFSK